MSIALRGFGCWAKHLMTVEILLEILIYDTFLFPPIFYYIDWCGGKGSALGHRELWDSTNIFDTFVDLESFT